MITILAKIKALYNDSKRYHWQCNGKDFNGDHQLFDRSADTFSNDVVDGLVEIYYMGEHREELEDLNELSALVSEEEGYKFSEEELHQENVNLQMVQEIASKVEELLPLLNEENKYSQAVMNKLDELASSSTQILGLLKARISNNVVMSKLQRLF